jgi:hypothetical protein
VYSWFIAKAEGKKALDAKSLRFIEHECVIPMVGVISKKESARHC